MPSLTISNEAFGSLALPLGNFARATMTTAPRITGTPTRVPVLLVPAASGEYKAGITSYNTGLALAAVLAGVELTGVEARNFSIGLSMIFALFPKFVDIVADGTTGVVLERLMLRDVDIRNLGFEDEGPIDLSQGPLKGLVSVRADVETIKVWEIYGMMGIILYSLGKTVTTHNFIQLTERRPAAIAGALDATITPGGYLTAARFPSLDWIRCFKGAMTMNPLVRSAIVREVVAWIGSSAVSGEQKIVAVSCRLWQGSGWTHVRLISRLILSYRDELMRIGGIDAEASQFADEYQRVQKTASDDMDFRKVIDPSNDTLSSRKYENLLRLAVEVARRSNPRMVNYAPGLAQSAHLPILEAMLEEDGRKLPVAPATTGGII